MKVTQCVELLKQAVDNLSELHASSSATSFRWATNVNAENVLEFSVEEDGTVRDFLHTALCDVENSYYAVKLFQDNLNNAMELHIKMRRILQQKAEMEAEIQVLQNQINQRVAEVALTLLASRYFASQ